jgi:hypothetical protein
MSIQACRFSPVDSSVSIHRYPGLRAFKIIRASGHRDLPNFLDRDERQAYRCAELVAARIAVPPVADHIFLHVLRTSRRYHDIVAARAKRTSKLVRASGKRR